MSHSGPAPAIVLSIAGFDPTSGAGVTADIKTIAANNGYGVACITALTVQNTTQTRSFHPVDPIVLEEQLEFLLTDLPPQAVKIGMLGSVETVRVVIRSLSRHLVPWVVLDPIVRASSGAPLIDPEAIDLMKTELFPMVSVITPNLAEAELLTGITIQNLADMERAAAQLRADGVPFVVVTGGHLDKPIDVLYDGTRATTFAAERVRTGNTHGTGCTFSSALATNLALGKQMSDAVVQAKAFVTAALKHSYPLRPGHGPLNHLFRLDQPAPLKNIDPAPQHEFTTR